MPATTSPSDRIPLAEAAKRGYGGYSTLRRRISDGELPAARVGRRILVRVDDLEAMAEPVVGRPTDAAQLNSLVDGIVANAPRLNRTQRERLSVILGGGVS